MKKFMYAALAVAAVLLFASCKNDKNQPNDQEKADAFISFTFNLPQGGTRAEAANVDGANAGDTYVGTTDEQAIKGVRVVLFDETSGIVKYALTYNITGTGSAAPTGDIAGTATTANFTTKAKAVVSQDYQMLAIINPTAEVIAATAEGKYLKDAQAAIETTVEKLSANGIMMSNEQGLVKVAAGDMKDTEGAAEGAPIKVNVDRILAKVFVGGTPTFEHGKLTNIKWQLNVTNKKTFIYRQLAQVMKTTDNFVAEVAGDNSKRFDRYAKDPNFLAGEFNAADFTYLEGKPELKGTFGYDDANGQYCLENTMDAPMQKHQGTTSFILSGTWTPDEHDGITFTEGETWYSYMGFTFTKDKMLAYKRIIEDNTNTKPEIDKTPAGFKAALKAALEGGLTVDAQGDVTASTTVKGIKAYKDGACYYQTNLIRHFNDTQSSKDMGYGRYGVVRNNIYKINISKISQPGEPEVVNEKDDDENDDPTKVFVSFDITINPWIVRTQDISL
ncbi:MAG: Mfa1 family fimbria major subunit [Porphyromonas sp.]|uniref:Mfa1 family fimbria major subunit n=1 Tax=Porphyromonas sp. TaxID=1924944 RepID=UPI001A51C9DF|nr:Mfa1 family fimbria major subunit [Porphyromonas sp.]MBL6452143.1 Mfa1 family fimbria major subunit [Porphyromonas sp.]